MLAIGKVIESTAVQQNIPLPVSDM